MEKISTAQYLRKMDSSYRFQMFVELGFVIALLATMVVQN